MITVSPRLRATMWLGFTAIAMAGQAHASCRVGDAAARGGQTGFDRAQAAAQTLASNESQAQTALQKCLSAITVRKPSNLFLDLGDIFGQLVQKVCYAVSSEVNTVTSKLDLTSQINNSINEINQGAGNSSGGLITNPVHGGVSTTPVDVGDFWSSAWK